MAKRSPNILLQKGIPMVLIPGLMAALALGWSGKEIGNMKNWYESKQVFPSAGVVKQVEDGDTFLLTSGHRVRLLGINAPDRGDEAYASSSSTLTNMIAGKKVFLEYDRYQDDKYGRILAWVWIECEKAPSFLPANYMHKTYNTSWPQLTTNPIGCQEGKLINEQLVRASAAKAEVYKDRGPLKYEDRITK